MNILLRTTVISLFGAAAAVGCGRTDPTPPPTPTTSSTTTTTTTPPATSTAPTTSSSDTTATTTTTTPSTSVGQKVDDATITAKVKTALLADDQVKGTALNVDTTNGVVSLTGSLDNQALADKAMQLARGVEGVSDVRNNITVK